MVPVKSNAAFQEVWGRMIRLNGWSDWIIKKYEWATKGVAKKLDAAGEKQRKYSLEYPSSLDAAINQPGIRSRIYSFAKSQWSEENFEFYGQMVDLQNMAKHGATTGALRKRMTDIYDYFVGRDAQKPVNIAGGNRVALDDAYEHKWLTKNGEMIDIHNVWGPAATQIGKL